MDQRLAAINKIPLKMSRYKNRDISLWFVVLLILFLKSEFVVLSLYQANSIVFLLGCIAFAPILFLMSFALIFPPKGGIVYLFFLDLFVTFLFIADMLYARAFGHLISIHMIFANDILTGIGVNAISLVHWTDAILLIDLPLLFLLAYKSKKRERIPRRILLFVFSLVLSVSAIALEFQSLENNNLIGNNSLHPLMMSPIGNHMYDIYRFVYDKNDSLNAKETNIISQWISDNKKYLAGSSEYSNLKGLVKGKNIITIQCESLENFVLNYSYDGQEVTPNINALLKSSIYFNNIVEQVNDGNSSDAELMFNTSVYPIDSGSAFLRFGKNDYMSLPKLLNQQGYTSIAIHGDDKEFWNRDQIFPKMGYDHYVDESQFADQSTVGMGLSDVSLFEQTILEINNQTKPYNIFAITLTSHMPFEWIDSGSMLQMSNEDVSARYLQSIHYLDMALGAFYNELQSSGELANTIIVIYGDHQGVHKYYDTTLPDNKYKIPFIICVPGLSGFEVSKIGGQVDMMPTLAYLLGIDASNYENTVMGRNLFGSWSGSGILASGDILQGVDGSEHLSEAYDIADQYIRGNYYSTKVK